MNNNTPSTPSYLFGYWRPWKENSNMFDSYLDYTRDTSLAKYSADIVGNYLSEASREQTRAIEKLGFAIGRGMSKLSNQMLDINETLGFLNRNMSLQLEQQKLSNLLLKDIAELLRVPDSEKERQRSIELGVKFFINASEVFKFTRDCVLAAIVSFRSLIVLIATFSLCSKVNICFCEVAIARFF